MDPPGIICGSFVKILTLKGLRRNSAVGFTLSVLTRDWIKSLRNPDNAVELEVSLLLFTLSNTFQCFFLELNASP